MPWTKRDYPPSLKNFEPRLRNKAVEIANALLEEGYEEGRAIAIATAQAKEWDDNHPDHSDSSDHSDRSDHSDERKKHSQSSKDDHDGANSGNSSNSRNSASSGNSNEMRRSEGPIHVVPHDKKWAIKAEGSAEPEHITDTKAEAVEKAKKLASDANQSAIIHRQNGTVETSHNYK
ncbi:DUF2188 domain-containing protein [Paenibacillus eucommiae]|uniref:Uncharacterized protein YdaT n=1 Tax=Paenibacillus eucommiae TaxID=1355755 RepID=A0ABS4ITW8_9BACL|nr:DUF2188 domain-containing protein [Paenibacillus eucommiae]MBP1990466.1 uncharacterized protein YdaT [Paenibacillus eucommiae]